MRLGLLTAFAYVISCKPANEPVDAATKVSAPPDSMATPTDGPSTTPMRGGDLVLTGEIGWWPPERLPSLPEDEKVLVNDWTLEMSVDDDNQCVIAIDRGDSSRTLETNLQAPCHWVRWTDSTLLGKTSNGYGFGTTGDVLAYRLQEKVVVMLIGNDLRPVVSKPRPDQRCGGTLLAINIDSEGLESAGRSNQMWCTIDGMDMPMIWTMATRDRHGLHAGEVKPDAERSSPTSPDDLSVEIDGQRIELANEEGQCILRRTDGGSPSTVRTGLNAPCHWVRRLRPGRKSQNGEGLGDAGNVFAHRFAEEPVVAVLVGDELTTMNADPDYRCGGRARAVILGRDEVRLGGTLREDTCTHAGFDLPTLWALSR